MTDTMRAILSMVLAMALLALSDLFIKLAGQTQPTGQIMTLLSLGGSVLFVLLARVMRVKLWHPLFWSAPVIWRNVTEIIAGAFLVLGIVHTPLSVFAAIMQAAPLIVTLAAALMLRERVGWRRWVAVCLGFLGMLLVIRPWEADFSASVLFALAGVSALALRDVVTRRISRDIPSVALSTWGFVATIPAGVLFLVLSGDAPSGDPAGLVHIGIATLVTAVGYYFVTNAMRLAPASSVAPFRYTRLLFTMSLGILVFGERPEGLTLLGAAIILVTGLYTFLRERRLANAG